MNRLELIEKINSLKIVQTDYPDEFEFPEEIKPFMDDCDIVRESVNTDKRRWYETDITVYEYEGEYFGIRFLTQLYSEQSSIEDIYHILSAIPMKAIQTVSYVKE